MKGEYADEYVDSGGSQQYTIVLREENHESSDGDSGQAGTMRRPANLLPESWSNAAGGTGRVV